MDFRVVFYIDLTTDFFMSHFTTRLCFNVSIEGNRALGVLRGSFDVRLHD